MNTSKRFTKIMLIAGSFALGLMLQTTAAEAGGKHKDRRHGKRGDHRVEQRHEHRGDHRVDRRDRYGYDYRVRNGVRYDRHRRHDHAYNRGRGHKHGHNKYWKRNRHDRFRIPNRIVYRSRVDYRPYFWGERYSRRHGHMHMVYRFPIYTDYGMDYRAVSYCGDDYYRTGRFVYSGPRLGFEIRF